MLGSMRSTICVPTILVCFLHEAQLEPILFFAGQIIWVIVWPDMVAQYWRAELSLQIT
jgi:hypothetical protein